jgi:predicted transcriptional regulator
MDFRHAIDRLGERVTHEQVANALGVSVASVRQYRLSPRAKAHRSPPDAWPKTLARLAKERSRELKALADELERNTT